ncbi:MAG: zf-HC2 domain-containing protein [Bryobacterales bacterium]|nr:zf-HC2 domain-containing protein [Bryobacterales bacterium]
MTCNCAEFEILLCDAVDGTLRGQQQQAFEAHRQSCAACNELATDVLGVTAFIERVAEVEPPKELLTRILFETSGSKAAKAAAPARGGLLAGFRNLFGPILQPRLAMGMAMTILSVSMLAQVFGLEIRQLKATDLEPAKIWAGVEDGAHRQWSRMVKYYENIRVVYEIQSRLAEWAEQETQERAVLEKAAQEKQVQQRDSAATPQKSIAPTPSPGR